MNSGLDPLNFDDAADENSNDSELRDYDEGDSHGTSLPEDEPQPSWHDGDDIYDDGYNILETDRVKAPGGSTHNGSYNQDICALDEDGHYAFNKRWPSYAEFSDWYELEKDNKSIGFKIKRDHTAAKGERRIHRVCERGKSGGPGSGSGSGRGGAADAA